MRVALGIEYDGSVFSGWQTQPAGSGVQDVVEHALAQIAGARVATFCAGRTDAGVHALAQVVHFDVANERPPSAWVRGVNAFLPPQVAVLWAQAVADDFNARHDARERCYRYVLLNHPVRAALHHGRVGWFHAPLDVAAMRAGAAHLLGTQDFSAFRSSECQAKSPVRELRRVQIERRGDLIVFELAANAFLHHMVRNIIGSLVYVGSGRQMPAWMGELLAGRDRTRAAPTFDAAGLYLAAVAYEAKWNLPSITRRAWFDE